MIVGTGIDMIEVDRVADKISKDNGFLERVFSADEIHYCNQKKNKNEHYAARFAAKEAFLKATGKGLLTGFDLHLIELIPNEDGKPELFLKGVYNEMYRQNNWKKIHVSLTHLNQVACAMVIIEA
jgi:holo-[acyl-carrier protein] synthase